MRIRRPPLPFAFLITLSACASHSPTDQIDPRNETSWYEFDWLSTSPHSPRFAVLDTESSLGPYAERTKVITIGDLVRMHGHACDGLVIAAAALSVGFGELYPDGTIDRTDTGCITNNSPCFGDVAAYLTGGRIRFGTQKIDPSRGVSFVLYRFSTGEAIEVALHEGLFPRELQKLETKLKTGAFTHAEMRACQVAQWDFAKSILQTPLADSFRTRRLPEFAWVADSYEKTGPRGDIINRASAKLPATDS